MLTDLPRLPRERRTSQTSAPTDAEPKQVQQLAGAVRVCVLVEHALARTAAHLLRLCRILEERAVRCNGLIGVGDNKQLAPRLEPALDAHLWIRDDRRRAC